MKRKYKRLIALVTLLLLLLWIVSVPFEGNYKSGTLAQSLYCIEQSIEHGIRQNIVLKSKPKVPCFQSVLNSVARDSQDFSKTNCTYSESHQSKECSLEWITFATSCSHSLNELASIVSHSKHVTFTILGWDSLWLGFGKRIRVLRNYLSLLPPHKIIIFTDGDDMGFLPFCEFNELVTTFKSISSPILFGAEYACWPDPQRESEYPEPPSYTPHKHLNAGYFIGYVWAIQKVIDSAYEYDCMDDQRGFTTQFLSQLSFMHLPNGSLLTLNKQSHLFLLPNATPFIQLDYFNSIFQSLNFVNLQEDLDLSQYEETRRITNTKTGGSPCIFHQNGDKSKKPTLWDQISNRLSLHSIALKWDSLIRP